MDSFNDLQSMRLYDSGPIPFDKILWYAVKVLWLDDSLAEIFTSVIRQLDVVYLEWQTKEQEKGKPKGGSSPGKGGAKPPSKPRRPARRR